MLLVTTLSKSEASNMKVYLYRETVSPSVAVKYPPFIILTCSPKVSRPMHGVRFGASLKVANGTPPKTKQYEKGGSGEPPPPP